MSLLEDLAKAIHRGDSAQVDSLLTSGSIDVNARLPCWLNPPPLVFAVRCKACGVGVVEKLLSAGAHIDGVDDSGQTACFTAIVAQSVVVLSVLLAHRPNLELKDHRINKSPLRYALEFEDVTGDCLAVMLINAGASLDSVVDWSWCSFASRSVAAIQALLNRGVVVNQLRGISNFTPLHAIASSRGNSHSKPVVQEVVKMLVNVCGVDLEAPTSLGRTCTHVAACTREDPSSHYALRCFIDAGADVNNVDHAAHTPLHLVSDYKCTVLLLAAGANVNARDRQGRTAFDLAVSRRSASLLPVFVAAGAETELSVAPLDADRVETARREIAKTRLDLVRERALHVCVGLQSLSLDALQVCEILQHACGPVAHLIAFHHWWTIATTVKHFNAPKTN